MATQQVGLVHRVILVRRRTRPPEMSDLDQTVLFEQFVAAREQVIALTDRFDTTAIDDPSRGSFGTMSCAKQILPGSCSNAGCGPGS